MFLVEFSPHAIEDLRQIDLYTSQRWGVQQADIYLEKLVVASERLAANPTLLGRSRPEIVPGLFTYHAERHFFVFRFAQQTLQILRILHQSMDLHRHLKGLLA